MRPRPPQRPQQQQHQHNNGYNPNPHQHNGFHQNPMMMNPQMMMMGNPMMMGHMNNMQNMPPMQPQYFNNMPQQQQQQQMPQFGLPPNPINQFLPNILGSLQFAAAAAANNNLMGGFQPQVNPFNPPPYRPPPPQIQIQNQNHQLGPPGFSEPRPQVQSVGNVNNTNNSNSKGNNFRNNFTNQQRFKGPGQGSQAYQGNNANKKFGFNKNHKGKGKNNKMPTRVYGSDAGNVDEETKRVYIPNYPPKEVQQWRQARRKNFPTKLNVEKKIKKNDSNSSPDEEAKLRRQQLREVLAKQRELGVEVAEVPSHYLSNPIDQVNGDNNGQFQNKDGKKGRFKHNKRKYDRKEKFNKKRKSQDKDSSQESSSITTREPTLLEKLLSADIKRDKIQLLQVFRFMVMNSFFKESPEQPLEFPVVMVEETGCEHVEEILSGDDDDDDDDVDGDSCDEASD